VSTPPRRIVVVLDGPPTPRWQERALAGLSGSPALEIVDVSLGGAPRRSAIRRAHAAIERHLFALGPDALAPVQPEQAQVRRHADSASATELVVWLSERPPPSHERRDVLYLRHGGALESAEDAFRRAVLRGSPCVETEVLLRSGDHTTLVERTVSGARPFSTTLSRDRALWKLTATIPRAVERAPGLDLAAPSGASVGRAPSTAELVVRSPIAWLRVITARILFQRPWRIRVRERERDLTKGWSNTRPLVDWKPGHLYADPFLFEYDGRHHLFCEEIPPGSNRGVISHTVLPVDGTVAAPPEPVLTASHHLSYPCVFSHEGEVFLIPETSDVRRVELYRAIDFPSVWQREAILLDGLVASDATLLAHDGRLWLFVGVAVPHATLLDELYLFSASAPQGPWQPHPSNPVVSDVRCARPAGAIRSWGSRLVRPAQDGSRRYGGAVSFRAIDELTTRHYAEHEIARLEPRDLGSARATHTYAADGRFEAIDLRRRELAVKPRVAQLVRRLKPARQPKR
jgi:hypothetical protein